LDFEEEGSREMLREVSSRARARKSTPGGMRLPNRDGQAESDPPQRPKKDSLTLSPAARRSTPSSSSVNAEVGSQDVTLGLDFNDRFRLTSRYWHDSPTSLNGGGLLKLEYDLGADVTAFAGGGHLPGMFRHSIGPNRRVDSPHSVAFAGVRATPGTSFDLGSGFRADLSLDAVAVATAAFNHEVGGFDPNTSAGLSKATVTGEAFLAKRFGDVDARVGYGQHLDLGMIGSYYATGGRGLFPQTHYAMAGLAGQTGKVAYSADAYLPIASATSEFSGDAKFRGSVGMPDVAWAPTLSVVAGKRAIEQVDLTKAWQVGGGVEAAIGATAYRPLESGQQQWMVSAGIRIPLGGSGSSGRSPRSPDRDWRAEPPRRRDDGPTARTARQHLGDYFTPAQIQAMRGKPVAELAMYLKTPEHVAAYLADAVDYDYARLKDSKGDYGSLRPDEVAALLKGVCRDQHVFAVEVMKRGGAEGRQVGYLSPDTSHAIAVYRDPKSGKWNVMEYGHIHYTEADDAETAFTRVRPDALVYSNWSDGGANDKRHQVDIRYSETAREYYRFVVPMR
jgi:hypothetical protein